MTRPRSIVTFELCYLVACVLGIANSVIVRSQAPAPSPLGGGLGLGVHVVGLIVSLAITIALWYFVARRGSVVAKWIVVLFFAVAAIAFLRALGSGSFLLDLPGCVAIVAFVLNAIAVWMLFRPDTRGWFAQAPVAGDPVA